MRMFLMLCALTLGACSSQGGVLRLGDGHGVAVVVQSDIPHTKECLRAPTIGAQISCEQGVNYQRGRLQEAQRYADDEEERLVFEDAAAYAWKRSTGRGFDYRHLLPYCDTRHASNLRAACERGIIAGDIAVAERNMGTQAAESEGWFRKGQQVMGPAPGDYSGSPRWSFRY